MSFSPLDDPLFAGLLGDAEIAALFSFEADLKAMLAFEAALAAAQAEVGLISRAAAGRISESCAGFKADPVALAAATAEDGVVVPRLVAQLRRAGGDPHAESVHRGATSQDVVDTSLIIRLKRAASIIDARLARLLDALLDLKSRDGAVPLIAHTRMQRALPFTAADKIDAWSAPLRRHRERLNEISPRLFVLQFGGPIGVRGSLDGKGEKIAAAMAETLGLNAGESWQTARDRLVELGSWLGLVAGALGKVGQDVALLSQNEVGEARLKRGGRSSSMPHKSNPVRAEILVALARFVAGQLGALNQALVHENERSGAAWTLEWLTLPSIVGATGAATRQAIALLDDLSFVSSRGQ